MYIIMTKTSTVSCSVSFSQFMNHYFKDVLSLSVSTKINTVSLRPQRAFLTFLSGDFRADSVEGYGCCQWAGGEVSRWDSYCTENCGTGRTVPVNAQMMNTVRTVSANARMNMFTQLLHVKASFSVHGEGSTCPPLCKVSSSWEGSFQCK